MIRLNGPWKEGYAFDIHTISSEFTGNNEYGHPTFDTKRSVMGQYLYKLKYGQHLPVISKIVALIQKDANFIRFISKIDIILPVPPSNKFRRIQPVLLVSQSLSQEFDKTLRSDVLSSTNKEELKNVETSEKYDKIRESVTLIGDINRSSKLLIFDDVFDSGSTINAITNVLMSNGYKNIYVFTLTKTRMAD